MHYHFRATVITGIRIIKKPHHKLDTENLTNTLIERMQRDFALTNSTTQWKNKILWRSEVRADIQSGIYHLCSHFFFSRSDTMFSVQKFHRFTIRNYISLKSPLLTQNFCEEMITSGNRLPVIVIVRTHDAQCTRLLNTFTEWFQIQSFHLTRSHVRIGTCTSIASTDWNTINGKMLRSGNDSFTLQTKNHLLTQFAYQIRIFSVTFNYTSPARILCDVQNRSINIGISECFRLICSDFRNFPD